VRQVYNSLLSYWLVVFDMELLFIDKNIYSVGGLICSCYLLIKAFIQLIVFDMELLFIDKNIYSVGGI